MKRILALLLGIVLLMATVPALADEETDDLNEIARKVEEEYLLPLSEGEGAKTEVLEVCLEMLKDAKGGPKKKPLELYCQVLLAIEKGDFDDANYTMFVLSQGSMKKTFNQEFIEKSGGESITSLLTIEELALYLQGREAEQNNERDAALAAYDQCNNRADAYYRIKKIEDEQYDDAIEMKDVKGEVIMEHVNFGYDENKVILKDINLYAHAGQKVAFVGSTGAGKTTITNLLNRFYDIQEGTITIDGIDVKKYKRRSLRENIAMVLQDTHLFSGTVRENIRYGRPDASDEEVEQAAKTASAHSFIMRLEDGYDTVLEGDGTNLSQGQRQLLAIARAAVADPPVLILDEATSSIDTRTERIIQESMDRLMHGRTTFVIAHRLSTVRNSDCIMVLEQGRIIERGTHDQLIEEKGKYYQLYTGNAISA